MAIGSRLCRTISDQGYPSTVSNVASRWWLVESDWIAIETIDSLEYVVERV